MGGAQYNSSKGRWLGIAAVLVCLFLLAAVAGYLLQRGGSEVPQDEDSASLETTAEPPASNIQPPAEQPASGQTNAGAPSGEAPGEAPPEAEPEPNPQQRVAKSAPKASQRPPSTSAQRAPEPPPRVEPSQRPQEGGATPPPVVPVPPVDTPPATAPPVQPSAPPTSVVAEVGTFGGEPPVRRAPPNTRVLKPEGQAPPANQPPSGAQPGLQPPSTPAPVEEGIIYWTGRLQRNQVVVIEGAKASVGQIEGRLPGTPVDVWLPSPAVVLAERPNPDNNWSRVAFRCVRNTDRNVTVNVQWKRLR